LSGSPTDQRSSTGLAKTSGTIFSGAENRSIPNKTLHAVRQSLGHMQGRQRMPEILPAQRHRITFPGCWRPLIRIRQDDRHGLPTLPERPPNFGTEPSAVNGIRCAPCVHSSAEPAALAIVKWGK
jgi:hypothetical protein